MNTPPPPPAALLDLTVQTLETEAGQRKHLEFRVGQLRFTSELDQADHLRLLEALLSGRPGAAAILKLASWYAPPLPIPPKARYFDLTLEVLNPRRTLQ